MKIYISRELEPGLFLADAPCSCGQIVSFNGSNYGKQMQVKSVSEDPNGWSIELGPEVLTDEQIMNRLIELSPYSTIPNSSECKELFDFVKSLIEAGDDKENK